ncbi:hypothetical protein B484DRAFT_402495, partial [Ochromonadaceae sp. CCMP2298]
AGASHPPDVKRILNNRPSIVSKLTPDQFEELVTDVHVIACEGLAATANKKGGTISDAAMEKYIEGYFGSALSLVENNTNTTDRVINQWRATILTDEGTIAEVNNRLIVLDTAAKQAVEKAAQKKANAALRKASKQKNAAAPRAH